MILGQECSKKNYRIPWIFISLRKVCFKWTLGIQNFGAEYYTISIFVIEFWYSYNKRWGRNTIIRKNGNKFIRKTFSVNHNFLMTKLTLTVRSSLPLTTWSALFVNTADVTVLKTTNLSNKLIVVWIDPHWIRE